MQVAIPTDHQMNVKEYFHHSEYFTLYEINNDNEIVQARQMVAPKGCACKNNIALMLNDMGVTEMLVNHIGSRALDILNLHGINVLRGIKGNISQVITEYLLGTLNDSGMNCPHQDEDFICNQF